MNTTVNELKELYESLGGTPSDVAGITTIPDMIAALAEVAGTTIELPAVSSTDNGDVLTVVSGKWAKADPPKELPASAAAGQVLTYNDGAWGAANVPTELPASATSGQVLTYNGSAWGAANVPSGGVPVYSAEFTNSKLSDVGTVPISFSNATKQAIQDALNNGMVFCVKIATMSGSSTIANVTIPITGMPVSTVARGSLVMYHDSYGASDVYLFALSFSIGSPTGTLNIMKLTQASP